MLPHISISVQNPPHVANVLAKIMGGKPFPSPFFLTPIWNFNPINKLSIICLKIWNNRQVKNYGKTT